VGVVHLESCLGYRVLEGNITIIRILWSGCRDIWAPCDFMVSLRSPKWPPEHVVIANLLPPALALFNKRRVTRSKKRRVSEATIAIAHGYEVLGVLGDDASGLDTSGCAMRRGFTPSEQPVWVLYISRVVGLPGTRGQHHHNSDWVGKP
jgi:hypothetical protein